MWIFIEVRPLFMGRFATDNERGPAHLDLFLDSVGLQLGVVWAAPPDGALRGIPGLDLGVGFDVPFLPQAEGLHVGVLGVGRFVAGDLGVRGERELDGAGSFVLFTLSWHEIVDAGLVDVGDALTR